MTGLPTIAVSLLLLAGSSAGGSSVPLAGVWRFALDRADVGIAEHWPARRLRDSIRLPGMLTAQGYGDPPSIATQWTGDPRPVGTSDPDYRAYQKPGGFKIPFWLQPPRHYLGPAWYQREVAVPRAWAGRRLVLFLERPHWQTRVWLDGREIGTSDRLGTPHEIGLGSVSPGPHTLTIRVDNRMIVDVGRNAHSVSDHTQGNWNGIVGRLELRSTPLAWLEDVQVFPRVETRSALVHVWAGGTASGTVLATARPLGGPVAIARAQAALVEGRAELTLALGESALLWDEFTPNLYELQLALDTPAGRDLRTLRFGLREVGTNGTRLTLNGRKIFLRGTLECAIFPLTGHPPTDVESWRRIVRIAKEHGLNHIRFHSWCPPEAAFDAADELGFYYQVEASSWPNQGAQLGSGWPLDAWLEAEAGAIVRSYGNHPSFLMLAHGNEPDGPNHREWLRAFVARFQQKDRRRLYTTGSGWPVLPGSDYHSSPRPRIQQWGEGLDSVINSQPPRTDFDWSGWVREHPDAPTVSHEIGQWCVHPAFKEIEKYTGFFKARNFEVFRDTARRNGVLGQAEAFLQASGKLQTLCYKAEIEAALRTPGLGGFQLLDLHDFPGQGTALVGVLDAFWDSKGYVTPREYRRFCGPVVPLARMKRLVFTEGETLFAEVQVANFGARELAGPVEWALREAEGPVVESGTLADSAALARGELHSLGSLRVALKRDGRPRQLSLELRLPDAAAANAWNVWVYPAEPDLAPPADVRVARELDEAAEGWLRSGGKLLWMPEPSTLKDDPRLGPIKMGFSPIFWNTVWTDRQPPHTLGILCDPAHEALRAFPTASHSDYQWWEILHGAAPFVLTGLDLEPIVQVIDDWVTARKLGLVFEAKAGGGRLIACSADLESALASRPAARQLRASLLRYMGSPAFRPRAGLTLQRLRGLVRPPAGGGSGR